MRKIFIFKMMQLVVKQNHIKMISLMNLLIIRIFQEKLKKQSLLIQIFSQRKKN